MINLKRLKFKKKSEKKNINIEFNFEGLVILRISKWLNCLQKFASYFEAKVKIQIHNDTNIF